MNTGLPYRGVTHLDAKMAQQSHSVPDPEDEHLHLHYTQPSTEWNQALPIGNGRLGAMVHGRTDTELLQLNEDSVWYGGPQDRTPRDALRNLPLLRQLIREGRHAEAEELVRTAFFATPASMRHYEPLGNCYIEFGHEEVSDYRRRLDLSRAVCETEYTFRQNTGRTEIDIKPVKVKRQAIASHPDQVLLLRVTASRKIKLVVRLNRVSEIEWETNEFLDSVHAGKNQIVLRATPGGKDSNQLAIVVGVCCDDADEGGSVESVGNERQIPKALLWETSRERWNGRGARLSTDTSQIIVRCSIVLAYACGQMHRIPQQTNASKTTEIQDSSLCIITSGDTCLSRAVVTPTRLSRLICRGSGTTPSHHRGEPNSPSISIPR